MGQQTNEHEPVGVAKLQISTQEEQQANRSTFISKRRRSSALVPPSLKPPNPLIKQKKRKNAVPPSLTVDDPINKKKFTYLRDFTLFALNAANECPECIKVTNRGAIEKVIVIIVPQLPVSCFGVEENVPSVIDNLSDCIPNELTFLKEEFNQMLVTTAPGHKNAVFPTMSAFTQRSLTKGEKNKITNQLKNEKMTIPKLKMTLSQLTDNGYPIHPDTEELTPGTTPEPLLEGWVDTKQFDHDGSHTFALDCEMCETANGKVLTRFSMIDFNENVIFDEFVKPEEEITDYLTAYSGITKEKLDGVTTKLKDIQEMILKHVSSTDFLIGHSLENDLQVLKLRHPNIVDTALVFEHPRGPPFKSALKYLTKKYLDKVIQEGAHDSVEDSKCCLDLVKLKLVEGGLLGKVISSMPISEDIRKVNKAATIIDYCRVQPNQTTYIQCHDDDEVTDTIINSLDKSQLVLGSLREFERIVDTTDVNISRLLCRLNMRLTKIYSQIPSNTALIVTSGSGDLADFNRLKMQKESFGREYTDNPDGRTLESSWTLDDEAALTKALEKARLGVTFLKIKVLEKEISPPPAINNDVAIEE